MNKLRKTLALASLAGFTLGAHATPLVDPAWLAGHLDDGNVVVVDLRKDEDYAAGHIPGALNAAYGAHGWRETVDGIIGMLPPIERINALIGDLGITPDSHVVVVPYGKTSSDVGAAARVYWTFKVLGHEDVSLLDGGHQGWVSHDASALDTTASTPVPAGPYPGKLVADLVTDSSSLRAGIEAGSVRPIDARIDEQWVGEAKHDKARIAGAIPTAARLPQAELVDPATGRFVSPAEVRAVAQRHGWDTADGVPLVSYCNTGHWAATAWFALSEIAGLPSVRLYDGSMVAWTADEDNPTINTPGRLQQIIKQVTGS